MDEEDRRIFLSITAYGIHSRYCKMIEKEIEKEFGIKSTFIYEYFLDTPIVKDPKLLDNKKGSGFYPFLLRILNEQRFVPIINKDINKWQDIKFLPFTFENLWRFWNFESPGAVITDIKRYTIIGKNILEKWYRGGKSTFKDGWVEYEPNSGITFGLFTFPIKFLRKNYFSYMRKYNKLSHIGALKEQLTIGYPFASLHDDVGLNVAAISLSSKKIFYGYVLICYPNDGTIRQKEGIFVNNKSKESGSIKKLKQIIINTYIPILLLYENYWREKVLIDCQFSPASWEECIFLNHALQDSDNDMERSLYLLWTKRKEFYEESSPEEKEEVIKKLEDNLVFSKYLIASPGMVEELKRIITPKSYYSRKDYLPSFLVIGGPGSGKEKMAQIIPLFYPEYRFGRRYVINMAALKPDFLSVPLMSGGDVELITADQKESKKASKLLLRGIFEKIWEQHKKEYPAVKDKKKIESVKATGSMPVVILDELNSLDIDAQGALLRVLENASLQPLGGIDDEKIDFLAIGIVNEPEDVLTLHEPLQKFLTERTVLGGILGKALYEYFRGMRRLREDLYFRFVREGKIRLPNLSERRMDIPVLFTFFLVKELPEEVRWKNLWVDLDVFDELMKEAIAWSGNFRELQSVAKRTAQFALSDPENQKKISENTWEKPFRISYKHIEDVVKEFFPTREGQTLDYKV